ncbi:MAG: hypothetical protein SGARI_004179, partial [Bacillariaceae sp.]
MQFIDAAINHVATDVLDVDGVVQKIEINKVLDKIDMNELVSRIDFNEVLSTVDLDALLQRVDFNAILEKVDTNAIIAKSSTGIFSNVLDSMRTTVVLMDLYLWVFSRCNIWCHHTRQRCYLPPKPPSGRPGYRQREDRMLYPKGRTSKAVAVQGRLCGFVTKAIAYGIDFFTITLMFGALFQIIQWSMVLFLKKSSDEASEQTSNFKEEQTLVILALYCAYGFLYFFISTALAGQTLGMMIVGVRLVNCRKTGRHSSIGPWQALVRTLVLPLTSSLFWPLAVMGLYRRDGRMLHDYLAQTGMIYLWDAKMAQARRKAFREEAGLSVMSMGDIDDDSDDMDEYLMDENGNSYVGQEVVLDHPEKGESTM